MWITTILKRQTRLWRDRHGGITNMYGMKEILLKIRGDQVTEVNYFTRFSGNATIEMSVKFISK
jgi:hypothetical protein